MLSVELLWFQNNVFNKAVCSLGQRSSRLWEFIRDLLLDTKTCPSLLKWENAEEGIFRFVQSDKVARLWGERKCNPKMTYEKLSRAMR